MLLYDEESCRSIRFSEIAKRTPTQPRIEQQTNVIIPSSRQELFRNKRPVALSIAQRLKKVDIC